MTDQTGIDWPTCDEDGCIGVRVAATPSCLAHASDEERNAALKQLSEAGELDARGIPITTALFERILAAAPHDADNRPTFRAIRLDKATFQGDAGFDGATFQGDAYFDGATFQGDAGFNGATFEQARRFGPFLAYRGLRLNDVQFAQPVQIEASTIGVCCHRARFAGGVQFRLRWARVVLDDTDLGAPSILAGIPRLRSDALAGPEQRIATAWQRLLAEAISERPRLLSLQRANVAGLGLSSVELADCRFAGAHNLDQLRLEADVSFAAAPVWLRWDRRQVIAEERTWRAPRSHRWPSPRWPTWLGDEPEVLEAGQIAGLYRALRKGREDAKDEPGAADFYYGEMEMRRHARAAPTKRPAGGSSGSS